MAAVQKALLDEKQVEDVAHQYPRPPVHEAHDVYAGYVPQPEVVATSPYVHVEEEVKHEPAVELVGHQYPDEVLTQATQLLDTHAVEEVEPNGEVVPKGHCTQEEDVSPAFEL